MNTTQFLHKQLTNINTIFHSIVEDIEEHEWETRPIPGGNLVGYMVWHIPRVQDHMVQTWIRGVPELFHDDSRAHWQHLRRLGNSVGITPEEADEIANTVQRVDALKYADAVHQEISTWLNEIEDNDLDQIPDAQKHLLSFPEYQTLGYQKEMDDLFGLPIWSLLMRPCIGHIHRHLGELQVVKQLVRPHM